MKGLYLILAIVRAVVPYAFFIQHFSSEGVSLPGFVTALFANPAAGGFTADLLFKSIVFRISMFQQRGREKGPRPILFIVLNLLIGLSCAFPAYLYARERKGAMAREFKPTFRTRGEAGGECFHRQDLKVWPGPIYRPVGGLTPRRLCKKSAKRLMVGEKHEKTYKIRARSH